MDGPFAEGDYITPEGDGARVQRYAPQWIWVVTFVRDGRSVTVKLDDETWARLRRRQESGTHLAVSAVVASAAMRKAAG